MGKNRQSGMRNAPSNETPTISKKLEDDLMHLFVDENQLSSIEWAMQEDREMGHYPPYVDGYDTYGRGVLDEDQLSQYWREWYKRKNELYKKLEDETGFKVIDAGDIKSHFVFLEKGDYISTNTSFENEVSVMINNRVQSYPTSVPVYDMGWSDSFDEEVFPKNSFNPTQVIIPSLDYDRGNGDYLEDVTGINITPRTVLEYNGKTMPIRDVLK